MNTKHKTEIISSIILALMISMSVAQEHHHHGELQVIKPEPPKIFLDKSPRVVAYQLKRLDNQRLLMVERKETDPKYTPVYQAILTRPGMTTQFRLEAINALSRLLKKNATQVVIEAISGLETKTSEEVKTADQLIELLIQQPEQALTEMRDTFVASSHSSKEYERVAGFAALCAAKLGETCFAESSESPEQLSSLLSAFRYPIDQDIKDSLLEKIIATYGESNDPTVRNAAITAMSYAQAQPQRRYEMLVEAFEDEVLRDAAVNTLLTIPRQDRPETANQKLANLLVKYAEDTPAEDRTSNAFTNAMQLADQSLGKLDSSMAKDFRNRLDAVTVRMIRIRTVEEEMRYDVPYFAVQAGKPIQIILENHDLMPHNLVITQPGKLKSVAQSGLNAGPAGGSNGLAYVPDSEDVLHATDLVASDTQVRLTFDAPTEPGEYPYVCTFPQHWYRMYGVMVVVEDLDQWLSDPQEPANPIGNNRSFVKSWSVRDLEAEIDAGVRGRTDSIGARLFNEASCRGCHQLAGEGGVIGPDLSKVVAKWKGNRAELLREILEPSHRVDEAYQMQKILTVDGQTLTGIRISEDKEKVVLMSNPEATEPISILQDDIEVMAPSAISMMPKALLDQYTKDEIFEIIAYIEASQQP